MRSKNSERILIYVILKLKKNLYIIEKVSKVKMHSTLTCLRCWMNMIDEMTLVSKNIYHEIIDFLSLVVMFMTHIFRDILSGNFMCITIAARKN